MQGIGLVDILESVTGFPLKLEEESEIPSHHARDSWVAEVTTSPKMEGIWIELIRNREVRRTRRSSQITSDVVRISYAPTALSSNRQLYIEGEQTDELDLFSDGSNVNLGDISAGKEDLRKRVDKALEHPKTSSIIQALD